MTNTPDIHEDVPSFSMDGSLIIYSANDGHDDEIYTMDTDGNQVKNISNSPNSNEARPKFVPSLFVSSNVVFDSDRDGNWEIYLAFFGVNGLDELTRLTNRSQYADRLPSYITTSERIVFRSQVTNQGVKSSRIYSINLDGSDLIKLSSDYTDWYPIASQDGKWILLVSSRDGNDEIYAMSPDGGEVIRLTNNLVRDATPSLSPDGRWLIFASETDGNSLHLFRIPFIPLLP